MADAEKASDSSEPISQTVYSKLRFLALLSKVLGAFPLKNARTRDGRKLQHSWKTKIIIWDVIVCVATLVTYINCCIDLVSLSHYTDENNVNIWLYLTCYIVALRGLIQFILLHCYASRLPKLFTALEEYHQVIGFSILKTTKQVWLSKILALLCTVGILVVLEITSLFFFTQFNNEDMLTSSGPVALSFMFVNLWKELPMNMFILIIMYLVTRFREIRDEVRKVREKVEKDAAKDLDQLRLQHAALTDIVSQVQSCYGTQLAVNLLFLVLDTILQLFVFFIVSSSTNVFLLVLCLYYFVMCALVLAIVEKLERTDDEILREIAAFELFSTPTDQQIQVQLFTSQITARPVKISASGFFFINNGLVASLLGAIATYLVVLIQFVPHVHQQFTNETLPSFSV